MSDPRGYAIFCDDIRHEVGGKRTWVGVYRNEMIILSNLPATVPKFGIVIILQLPADQPRPASVKLRIYLPGDPEDTPSVAGDVDMTGQTPELPPKLEDYDRWLEIGADMILSPLQIKQEGYIRIRAEVGGETLRIGALRIRQADQKTTGAA